MAGLCRCEPPLVRPQYENLRTKWGEEATADGKRTLCASIGRYEILLTIFLDESFRGSLSSWQALVRGEFHKNSDGALRQEFERMMESVLCELYEKDYPNPPYAALDISTAAGAASLMRHRAEDKMASLWTHLSCVEPDILQLYTAAPTVGKFPHPGYFAHTYPALLKREFDPWVMAPRHAAWPALRHTIHRSCGST